MSALASRGDIHQGVGYVSFVPILLQKSFWGDGRKFSEPLMHFARADVGDHIVSSKINHGPSQWR
jgi:hypothetical protein